MRGAGGWGGGWSGGADRKTTTQGHLSLPLLEAIEIQAVLRIDTFNSQDLSNTIWAFARLNHKPKQLMRAVASEAQKKLADFNPQGIANTLWAFATLAHYGEQFPVLLHAIATEALAKMHLFNPQNLANAAWAFARVGHHPGQKILSGLAHFSTLQLNAFKPQEMANLVWAFAKLGYSDLPFQERLAAAAGRKLQNFNPQNLANTVWAFATLGHHPRELIDQILPKAELCLDEFSQQGLSNTMWALAKLNHFPGHRFLQAVARQALSRIHSFSPQGFVNLAWAYAVFGVYDEELFTAISTQSVLKMHHFTAQDLSSLIWGCAVFNHCEPPNLVVLVGATALKKLPYFSSQGLADMIWGLATLQAAGTPSFQGLWDMATATVFSVKDLCQVHKAVEQMQAQGGVPSHLNITLVMRAAQAHSVLQGAPTPGPGGFADLDRRNLPEVNPGNTMWQGIPTGDTSAPLMAPPAVGRRLTDYDPRPVGGGEPQEPHSPRAGVLMAQLPRNDSLARYGEDLVKNLSLGGAADGPAAGAAALPFSTDDLLKTLEPPGLAPPQEGGVDDFTRSLTPRSHLFSGLQQLDKPTPVGQSRFAAPGGEAEATGLPRPPGAPEGSWAEQMENLMTHLEETSP